MKTDNIPQKEKFDRLVAGLTELEPIAAELARDPVHSRSPHIAPVRMKLLTAIEGLRFHAQTLAALPEAKPETKNPKPKADATAGAPAAR